MTTTQYANVSDFASWEAKAKTMTVDELQYAAHDCRQAAAAMRGWNPIKEGFYSDQANTYRMELARRCA